MRLLKCLLLFSFFVVSAFAQSQPEKVELNKIMKLKVAATINPAIFNYLEEAFEKARAEKYPLILIELNTPGGLVSTTKEILSIMGDNRIPMVVWVTPEGSSATSAGSIIASGAHFLFMSPGSNIGAATPINLTGDIGSSDVRKKAVNDLVALVSGLAEARGRSKEHFAKMVSEAASYTATEALKHKVIDQIISSEDDLVQAVLNKTVIVKGRNLELVLPEGTSASQVKIEYFGIDLGQDLLNRFADPSVAYILFILGAVLIYLEFHTAGGYIAGGLGVLCLVLAGVGFQVLPVNYGAIGLVTLGFVLFILEAFVTSYGLLTLGGLVSLSIGSLFIFHSEQGQLYLKKSIIFSTVGSTGLFLLLVFIFILKDRKKLIKGADFQMIGREGRVESVINLPGSTPDGRKAYMVKINAELWRCSSPQVLQIGDRVKVTDKDQDQLMDLIVHLL